MKKLIAIFVCSILASATNVLAVKGPQNVSNTRHNFASTQGAAYIYRAKAGTEDGVCIFCHTPHGGANDSPLWNRELPDAGGFTHYNSATLSLSSLYAPGTAETRPVSRESLLCLSCHDGSIAVNSLLNYSSVGPFTGWNNADSIVGPVWSQQGAATGTRPDGLGGYNGVSFLTDDHPISFSYYDVYNHPTANNALKLHTVSDAEQDGVRFFPLDGIEVAAGKRVECSSCHDPHVDASTATEYSKFLITSNSGSRLCLSCHIK